ncbi:MAG: glycosyltransferase [Anaerolineales bacterium]|nr:glycosyltransferase [Anaerolineales bacterium]
MFCSTIIPTVGRSTLNQSVQSVLAQTFSEDDFEVIVVNDSGKQLGFADWQESERVQIINTNQRERSVARNTGAAIAKGKYLHLLDDDDWMASDSIQKFFDVSKSNKAVWLYGVTQLVDRQQNPLIQLKHGLNGNCFTQVMAGEWIPIQSSLIASESFFKVGGFNPLISGPEDIDLLRRVALIGDLTEIQVVVSYVSRGDLGSTTDYGSSPEASRWAREDIIDTPQVFTRMNTSAQHPFWKGRFLRVYLTSFIWNIHRKRFCTAASRGVFGLLSFLLAGFSLLSFDYWRAVLRPYASETFVRGFKSAKSASSIDAKITG